MQTVVDTTKFVGLRDCFSLFFFRQGCGQGKFPHLFRSLSLCLSFSTGQERLGASRPSLPRACAHLPLSLSLYLLLSAGYKGVSLSLGCPPTPLRAPAVHCRVFKCPSGALPRQARLCKHTAIPPATSFVFCADAWASLPLSPCLNLPSPPIPTQQRIFTIERKLAKLVAFCGWRRDSSRSTRAPGRDVQGPDGFVAMTPAAEA